MKRVRIRGRVKKYLLVDDADFVLVSPYRWWYGGGDGTLKYVSTRSKGKTLYVHRLIMNPPTGMYVDHINGNPLDNRRSNLRIVDQTHNNANFRRPRGGTSKYKGVYLCKFTGRWRARCSLYGKTVNIGRFDTEEEAAMAYNRVAVQVFGEFAYLNKVPR